MPSWIRHLNSADKHRSGKSLKSLPALECVTLTGAFKRSSNPWLAVTQKEHSVWFLHFFPPVDSKQASFAAGNWSAVIKTRPKRQAFHLWSNSQREPLKISALVSPNPSRMDRLLTFSVKTSAALWMEPFLITLSWQTWIFLEKKCSLIRRLFSDPRMEVSTYLSGSITYSKTLQKKGIRSILEM